MLGHYELVDNLVERLKGVPIPADGPKTRSYGWRIPPVIFNQPANPIFNPQDISRPKHYLSPELFEKLWGNMAKFHGHRGMRHEAVKPLYPIAGSDWVIPRVGDASRWQVDCLRAIMYCRVLALSAASLGSTPEEASSIDVLFSVEGKLFGVNDKHVIVNSVSVMRLPLLRSSPRCSPIYNMLCEFVVPKAVDTGKTAAWLHLCQASPAWSPEVDQAMRFSKFLGLLPRILEGVEKCQAAQSLG